MISIRREIERRTCLTDSAISGPIPSPGKRVAVIRSDEDEEEKARWISLAELLGFRQRRFTIWEAIDDDRLLYE